MPASVDTASNDISTGDYVTPNVYWGRVITKAFFIIYAQFYASLIQPGVTCLLLLMKLPLWLILSVAKHIHRPFAERCEIELASLFEMISIGAPWLVLLWGFAKMAEFFWLNVPPNILLCFTVLGTSVLLACRLTAWLEWWLSKQLPRKH